MPRTPARATQADISRAIKAAKHAGENAVVEVAPDGTIRIVPAALAKPDDYSGEIKL